MSITIQATKFVNMIDGKESDISYGVRIYSDHEKGYINTWESIPETDMGILHDVIADGDDIINNMLDCAKLFEEGITINDTFYDYSEIKSIIH